MLDAASVLDKREAKLQILCQLACLIRIGCTEAEKNAAWSAAMHDSDPFASISEAGEIEEGGVTRLSVQSSTIELRRQASSAHRFLTTRSSESRESILTTITGAERIQLEPEEGVTKLLHAYLIPPLPPSLSLCEELTVGDSEGDGEVIC